MDRSRPSGDTSAYGKGRNGHGEAPYYRERGPWSEDSKAMKPPVGTGHRAKYKQKTILRGRAVQASDSGENTEGPRDCHPVGGMQMETPVDSGLFDTDDEGQTESEVKLQFEEDNVRETMPYEPTPDLDGRGERGEKGVSTGRGSSVIQQLKEEDAPPSATCADTVMTRTVITPSSTTREAVRTTIDSESQAVAVITYTCATTETSNSPTDSSTQVHAQAGSGSGDPRWRSGTPYFRNDGPHAGPTMPPTNVPEQRNEQPYPLQYMLGPHPTGQYGPMGSTKQQEDYVNLYNQELFRQYGGGVTMTNTVPIMGYLLHHYQGEVPIRAATIPAG